VIAVSCSPNQTEALIPDVSLTTKGGAEFPVTQPIIGVGNGRTVVGYCLAIMKNDLGINLNIIGRKPGPPVRHRFFLLLLGWT